MDERGGGGRAKSLLRPLFDPQDSGTTRRRIADDRRNMNLHTTAKVSVLEAKIFKARQQVYQQRDFSQLLSPEHAKVRDMQQRDMQQPDMQRLVNFRSTQLREQARQEAIVEKQIVQMRRQHNRETRKKQKKQQKHDRARSLVDNHQQEKQQKLLKQQRDENLQQLQRQQRQRQQRQHRRCQFHTKKKAHSVSEKPLRLKLPPPRPLHSRVTAPQLGGCTSAPQLERTETITPQERGVIGGTRKGKPAFRATVRILGVRKAGISHFA